MQNQEPVIVSSLRHLGLVLLTSLVCSACYFDPPAGLVLDAAIPLPNDGGPNPEPDAGVADSGPSDIQRADGEPADGPPADVEPIPDLGPIDADAEPADGAPMDAEPTDADPLDAPAPDVDEPDLGVVDAEPVDEGIVDAGQPFNCGDGVVEVGEQCDDGDQTNGDGCETDCSYTPGYYCIGSPSFCEQLADIAIVDQTGPACPAGAGAGTVADPYCRITSAVSSSREFIFVFGGTYAQTLLISDRTKTLIGDGATITSLTGRGMDIRDEADVTVRGFTIQAATDAVRVSDEGSRAIFEGNTIGPSGGLGVTVTNDGRISLRGNVVRGNVNGGVRLDSDSEYELVNNVIHENGTILVSEFGGVYSRRAPSGSSFVNNTIFDNRSRSTTGGVPGIRCNQATTISNTIVWNNITNIATPGDVSALCTLTYSFIGPGTTVSGTNRNEDPLLTADGHLSAGSPCIDAADPAGTTRVGGPAPVVDIDGDPRPGGALVDVGADEL